MHRKEKKTMHLMRDTWKHIRRSPYQSLAAVVTMFLTMLMAGFFALLVIGSSYILWHFEGKPQITVFFTNKATDADIEALKTSLMSTGKVKPIKFVSKEDALTIYREQNKNDPLLLEMVTADILPASLEVSTTDPAYLHELEPIMKQAQGVEEVIFQKDVVDTLLRWTQAIRLIGVTLVSLLAVNSILIVMTVIGMKIALKKDEIEILTLVGASPGYVRLPFVIEGGFYGSIGGFLSWTILVACIVVLRDGLMGFLGVIPVFSQMFAQPFSSVFLLSSGVFLGGMVIVGYLLGAVGSLVALARYLKF